MEGRGDGRMIAPSQFDRPLDESPIQSPALVASNKLATKAVSFTCQNCAPGFLTTNARSRFFSDDQPSHADTLL